MESPFDFSEASIKEEMVIIPESLPHPGKYVLREPTADTTVKYRNHKARHLAFLPGGKLARIENPGDIEPMLVSWCLFQTNDDGSVKIASSGSPVTVAESTIRKWPSPIIRKMFDWIKEVGQLDEPDDTEESLTTQIDKLTRKREELRQVKNE